MKPRRCKDNQRPLAESVPSKLYYGVIFIKEQKILIKIKMLNKNKYHSVSIKMQFILFYFCY